MMSKFIQRLMRKTLDEKFAGTWSTVDLQDLEKFSERFAQLIATECVDICMEMAAKSAGLPGNGALAKDCAYWIKQDFGVQL